MAHVFDIMASFTGQLNVLSSHYFDNMLLNDITSIPDFISIGLDRHLRFIAEKDETVDVDSLVLTSTHDIFNPLYIAVTSSDKPAVLKLPTIVTKDDKTGPAVATLVVVPKAIFSLSQDLDIHYVVNTLKSIYFDIANMDPNLSYNLSDKMITVGNKNDSECKLYVPTYDLTILYSVYSFIHIYIKKYFEASSLDIAQILLPDADNDAKILSMTFEKNCKSISSLRESFANGSILKDALYEE